MKAVDASDLLNSWKEIAAYLNRGVRTVQRWEVELGLPVRRPRGRSRSAVIAFRADLDQWLNSRPTRDGDGHAVAQLPLSSMVDAATSTARILNVEALYLLV